MGGVEEGVLAAGGLEDEEHPGQAPLVVPLSPAAEKVPLVGLQAGGDALRCSGPPLELQQVGTPPAPMLQGEGGVGMYNVGGPVVAVADAGTGGGQQVEQVVVRGAGDLGGQSGGEAGDAGVVPKLGGEGDEVVLWSGRENLDSGRASSQRREGGEALRRQMRGAEG